MALLLGFLHVALLPADELRPIVRNSLASKPDAKALYRLARRYARGDGVAQDYDLAARYLQLSAEQGYALAQNDLGAFYARGLGVEQDYVAAAKWYRQAAEQGDALAQYSLGRCYSLGRGVPEDIKRSLYWLRKAAKQHQPDALVALADICLNGWNELPPDPHQASRLLRQAARLGNSFACNSLGCLYEHGTGVKQDFRQAAVWFRCAAEKNDPQGQLNLSRMYAQGSGVKRDLVEACKWLYLAAENREGSANLALTSLAQQQGLAPQQAEEGRRRADEFKAMRMKRKAEPEP